MVTIGIPSYRRLDTLKEAADSALKQSYRPLEIIISMNLSGQPVDREIEEWALTWTRGHSDVARFHMNPKNLGMGGNWNQLLDLATGEYFVLLADDDRLVPGFVEKLVGALRPETQLVFSNHFVIDSQGKRDPVLGEKLTQVNSRAGLTAGVLRDREEVAWRNAIPICSTLFRTDAARKLRFREDLNTPETELVLRLAQEPGDFVFVPEALAEYRVHPGSETEHGLWYERLLPYLERIPASSPQAESSRRRFMGNVSVNAATRLILTGRRKEALGFVRSPYYRETGMSPLVAAQKLSLLLPAKAGSKVLGAFLTLRKAIKRHRPS